MSMKARLFCYIFLIGIFSSCSSGKETKSDFSFVETQEGIELSEGINKVFFFQKTIVSPDSNFQCNNFLHPLYSLDGDTLTELFPEDHKHHRGVFWAWHQIFVDTVRAGDGWMMEDVSFDILSVQTSINSHSAQIKSKVVWKSPVIQSNEPFIEEQTTITVQESVSNLRLIDFEIQLKALLPDVFIGGSEDEKGYGGFSVRIKLPEDLVFSSEEGFVTPQNLQIQAGQWMDFSASFNEEYGKSGLAILCHPSTANYVAPWILRQERSMQNIVFPGRDKVSLSFNEPIVLRYRMLIHRGRASDIDLPKLQSDYNKLYPSE